MGQRGTQAGAADPYNTMRILAVSWLDTEESDGNLRRRPTFGTRRPSTRVELPVGTFGCLVYLVPHRQEKQRVCHRPRGKCQTNTCFPAGTTKPACLEAWERQAARSARVTCATLLSPVPTRSYKSSLTQVQAWSFTFLNSFLLCV